MQTAPMRAYLGFVAAAIAVLTFHQGMVAALHEIGWAPFAPFRTDAGAAIRCSRHVSLCFWGGVYGAVFGLLMPRLHLAYVALRPGPRCDRRAGRHVHRRTDQGQPDRRRVGTGEYAALVRDQRLLGFGVGVILPLLMPRSLVRAHV